MDVANIDLVWFNWPQSKIPFDRIELYTIFSLDPDKDAERLKRKLFIRDECLRTMRVSTRLLQCGAEMHLNLCQLAEISCRENIDEPSPLEKLVKEAIVNAYRAIRQSSVMASQRLVFAMDLAVGSVPRFKASKSHTSSPSTEKKEIPTNSSTATGHLNDRALKPSPSMTLSGDSPYKPLPSSSTTLSPVAECHSKSSSPISPSPPPPLASLSPFSCSSSEGSSYTSSSTDSKEVTYEEVPVSSLHPSSSFSLPPSNRSLKGPSSPVQEILQSKLPNKNTTTGNVSFSLSHESASYLVCVSSSTSPKEDTLVALSPSANPSSSRCSVLGDLLTQSASPSPSTAIPPPPLSAIPYTPSSSSVAINPFSDSPSSRSSTSREKEGRERPRMAALPVAPAEPRGEDGMVAMPSVEPQKRLALSSMKSSSFPSSTFFDYPKRKPKKGKDKKFSKKGDFSVSENTIPLIPTLPSTEDLSTVGRGTRMSTTRRLNGGTAVRGTTYRQQIQENNTTWTLQDEKGHQIPIDWSDEQFEKKFFKAFETCLREYITAHHPNWREYTFYGDSILEELAPSNTSRWNKKHGFPYVSME
ncbi:phosphatidylinositol 3- and 4-kinase [Cardiosporidium cionae]|uniref:Phosphatidylinositol 3- and 4-kinase n=1 Tax=Cardiosporidium cionae TaxID=476202 RepID=A0ABQ7J4N5_9APIC|nr:phosphatidylinositol 3- and 4-kinase [Cardiosporidium cionae]|eukprot:KAF8817960.1 phosphatidylinositol 3- and 4-kinase [Cardiosporidium cionae]